MGEEGWRLVSPAGDRIDLRMAGQEELLPPIQLFAPSVSGGIQSVQFVSLPARNSTVEPPKARMNFQVGRSWELRRNGDLIDRYESDAIWSQEIVRGQVHYNGRVLELKGKRSTIHLSICDSCKHAKVTSVWLPLSMHEYRSKTILPIK